MGDTQHSGAHQAKAVGREGVGEQAGGALAAGTTGQVGGAYRAEAESADPAAVMAGADGTARAGNGVQVGDRGGLGVLVGYRLKQVQAALRSRIDSVLRPLGLTTPQYACLELLSRVPGASGAELARGAFVSRQTMSVVLRSLQDRGLVTRSSRSAGGRALPLVLTAQGEELCQRAAQRVAEVEELMVSGLSGRQGRELHEALTACAEALGGGAGPLVR